MEGKKGRKHRELPASRGESDNKRSPSRGRMSVELHEVLPGPFLVKGSKAGWNIF